jgi:hypothetical protein
MEYLFEMHTHTKEVSTCAVAYAEDLIQSYKSSNYAGFVLTNHLNASTFNVAGLADASWDEKIDHFMKGFEAVKKAAGDRFTVLLGFELNFYNSSNDYLVYGATEEFLRSHGDLMAMTPKQVSKLCRENGLLFIQAHPFRRGMEVVDWNILDGYEIFNGNPRHHSSNETAEHWAKLHNKTLVTSGSDFHEPEDMGIGGIYFKNPIETNDDLLRELRIGNYRLKITDIPYTRPE